MSNLPPNSSRRQLLQFLGIASGAAAVPAMMRAWLQGNSATSTAASASTALSFAALPHPTPIAAANTNPHRVALIKTTDRAAGIRQAIELLQPPSFSGKRVFIKPNYNTGDPAPAATDPAVLEVLVEKHEHVYPMVPAGGVVDDMKLGVVGEGAEDR